MPHSVSDINIHCLKFRQLMLCEARGDAESLSVSAVDKQGSLQSQKKGRGREAENQLVNQWTGLMETLQVAGVLTL